MATPESIVKKEVTKTLTGYGVYHFFPAANGYGRAGIPDIICCINGHMLAIECKAGKGRTTALQERELQRIRDAGGSALVIYDRPEDFTLLGRTIHTLRQL
ncbi:VRR-NUC domain containing protein [uncultured Caudovirales phage]|uniref:VRR-NUC domain containing protein n=1 Tax=uncultured Caudovirales phage TaxID=2100421 RepID=A0A6J5T8H6_9CAUD|nr:VRR-NUC domain containing protein [uncultured Caudovirales phage]CAB5218987.1 VRR-NUC domain containing protein [uncultured Caudovirales phage]